MRAAITQQARGNIRAEYELELSQDDAYGDYAGWLAGELEGYVSNEGNWPLDFDYVRAVCVELEGELS